MNEGPSSYLVDFITKSRGNTFKSWDTQLDLRRKKDICFQDVLDIDLQTSEKILLDFVTSENKFWLTSQFRFGTK